MGYGDQQALVCEIVDWARAAGFEVIAAGKGTKHHLDFHAVTPANVWDHYYGNLTPETAAAAGMNPQMFCSFIDGTKSGIEMTAIANATGLTPSPDGLSFPPVPTDKLQDVLIPTEDGGMLHHKGQVEVVSSLNADHSEIPNDLRWGVYAVFEAPNDYAMECFKQYGLKTDKSGRYSAMYRPYHLIGLELGISVLSAALRNEPTGQTKNFVSDVVSVAKRDLKAGETLDGEGGFAVWGKAQPAAKSLQFGALPIGLAHGVKLSRDIKAGETLRWDDVSVDETMDAVKTRRAMEQAFAAD